MSFVIFYLGFIGGPFKYHRTSVKILGYLDGTKKRNAVSICNYANRYWAVWISYYNLKMLDLLTTVLV